MCVGRCGRILFLQMAGVEEVAEFAPWTPAVTAGMEQGLEIGGPRATGSAIW